MANFNARDIVKQFVGEFFEAFKKEYIAILRKDFVNDFVNTFSELYDRYLIQPYPNVRPDDYTAPRHIKNDVVNYVRSSLLEGVANAKFEGDRLHLQAISEEVFSRPSRRSKDTLKLFYFYIHGTPGKFVVLGQREYERMGSFLQHEQLGRFGTVHMLPYSKYENMYRGMDGGNKGWPAPSDIIHPFSGAPPVRIFEDTIAKVIYKDEEYVEKAVLKAIKD